MTTRRADPLYAGAKGCIALEEIAHLGHGHALQPKRDGAYVVVPTDARGELVTILLRGGEASPHLRAEFRGVRWAPDAVLVGEIEAFTESANRTAGAQGFRRIHLFDALRLGGRDVSRLPYRARRDGLLRAESALVAADIDRPWNEDRTGNAHCPRTGQYVAPVPLSWRRMPVVPQMPASAVERALSEWVATGEAEGLAVVAQDAPIGRRRAKRKWKPVTTLDAIVLDVGARCVTLAWRGRPFPVSAAGRVRPNVGARVEVEHNGFTDRGKVPKHARLVRVREDLAPMGVQ